MKKILFFVEEVRKEILTLPREILYGNHFLIGIQATFLFRFLIHLELTDNNCDIIVILYDILD